ncbi:MAG: DNA polymerase III subunit delta [Phycisphaerales bacterium]|nr:DNA polymerase III subunit delta [Phycisphaerales bacterium]
MAKRPATSPKAASKPAGAAGKAIGTLGAGAGDRFIVLSGRETFLQQQRTGELREALKVAFGEIDTLRFDGKEADAAAVLDECRSFGLIATHKLVIVDDAEELVKEATRPLFERYAQAPCEGTTLVLRSSLWRPGKLDKMVTVIKCEEFKRDEEGVAWAVRRAADAYGYRLDTAAAEELVERTGLSLARLDSELGKLALAADRGRVDRQAVLSLVGQTRPLEPWPLRERLLAGNAESAIKYMRDTLENSKNTEIPLLFACTSLARDLYACAAAQPLRIPPAQLAARLGKRKESFIRDALAAATKLSPARAAPLLKACTRADAHAKSGVGRTDRTLETLAVLFAEHMR